MPCCKCGNNEVMLNFQFTQPSFSWSCADHEACCCLIFGTKDKTRGLCWDFVEEGCAWRGAVLMGRVYVWEVFNDECFRANTWISTWLLRHPVPLSPDYLTRSPPPENILVQESVDVSIFGIEVTWNSHERMQNFSVEEITNNPKKRREPAKCLLDTWIFKSSDIYYLER